MLSTENQRTSSKSENKFRHFFNRSRSRSRSKTTPLPLTSDVVLEIPSDPFSSFGHNRFSSLGDSSENRLSPVAESPRHTARFSSSSRPFSSATNGTETTVIPTPRTPPQTLRPKNHAPSSTATSRGTSARIKSRESLRPTRSPSPKLSTTRRKLHELFNIPLAISRRNSVTSRVNSPLASEEHLPPNVSSFPTHDLAHANPSDNVLNSSSARGRSPNQAPSARYRSRSKTGNPTSKLEFLRSPRLWIQGTASGNKENMATTPTPPVPVVLPISTLATSELVHGGTGSRYTMFAMLGDQAGSSAPPVPSLTSRFVPPLSSAGITSQPDSANTGLETSAPPPLIPPLPSLSPLPIPTPSLPSETLTLPERNSEDNTVTQRKSSTSSKLPSSPLRSSAMMIPKIIHTPATPERAVEPSSAPSTYSSASGSRPSGAGGFGSSIIPLFRRGSLDSQARVRSLSTVRESRSTRGSKVKGKEKFIPDDRVGPPLTDGVEIAKENERQGTIATLGVVRVESPPKEGLEAKDDSKERGSIFGRSFRIGGSSNPRGQNGRRSKHGSFDFEKPLFSFGGFGSSSLSSPKVNRSKESLLNGSKYSFYGRNGNPGRVTSASAVSISGPQLRTGSAIYPYGPGGERAAASVSSCAPSHASTAHSKAGSGTYPNTNGYAYGNGYGTANGTATGRNSSRSRRHGHGLGAGKYGAGTSGTHSGRTTPQLKSVGLNHHGAFSFEPAVPSPTMSDTSGRSSVRSRMTTASSVNASPNGNGGSGRSSGRTSGGRMGYSRVGGKGRSLDLGLGLSWAPNKVREDALMNFGRAVSLRSRARDGDSRSASSVGGVVAGENGDMPREDGNVGRSGEEVMSAFREALGDAGFASFSKYRRRFELKVIPFDGPLGIVARVERLLDQSPVGLTTEAKRQLLDDFVKVVLRDV